MNSLALAEEEAWTPSGVPTRASRDLRDRSQPSPLIGVSRGRRSAAGVSAISAHGPDFQLALTGANGVLFTLGLAGLLLVVGGTGLVLSRRRES